jgi:uncharacterized protein (DUF1330 family)
MKTFVIAAETINDDAMFSEYRKRVTATIERFGGQVIVRGGEFNRLEGEWPHRRVAIIEFPSRDAAQDWYNSPDYQKIIPLRKNSTAGSLIMVDGI